ncbi:MAG: hypothetical protein PWR03_42 [Tenuifilum sp.]|nr:hypothetical protein [Tenuifilum sp.]
MTSIASYIAYLCLRNKIIVQEGIKYSIRSEDYFLIFGLDDSKWSINYSLNLLLTPLTPTSRQYLTPGDL